jgi:hypothetical protein
MSIGFSSASGALSRIGAAMTMVLLLGDGAAAQQYLGNARQRCQGPLTVTTTGGALQVRPFEARSAEVGNATVQWQCPGQQPGQIECPANTNKVLIDRSQGGSIFSIICLQK